MKRISNPRKIIFVIKQLGHGGVQRVLYEIVAGISKSRYECHVVSFYQDEDVYGLSKHAKLYSLNDEKKKNILTILIRLRKKLRYISDNNEALLVPFLARPTAFYVALARLRRKWGIFASYHTAEYPYMQFNYSLLKRLLEKTVLKITNILCDKIIVHSIGIKQDLINNYGADSRKIIIIPNPFDVDKIQDLSQDPLDSRLLLNRQVLFCSVGRLSIEKNHELLISSVNILRNKLDDFVIYIVGDGERKEFLQSMVDKNGLNDYVKFTGSLRNPFSLVAKTRALVHTSHYDAYPMVLKEAMACGTVVISVDCPYGPRDILSDGKFGRLIPIDDPNSLAEAMYKIAVDDDLTKRYVTKGFLRAKEHSYKEIIRKWEKVLSQ